MRRRAPTLEDIPSLIALFAEEAAGGPGETSEDELRTWLTSPDDRLAFQVWEDDAGRLAAYADAVVRQGSTTVAVDVRIPERTLTPELLAAVHGWAGAHGRVHGAVRLRDALPSGIARERLLADQGFAVVRCFFHMRIDLVAEPDCPVWPDEIDVSTFRAEDARSVYDAVTIAFADHWEHHPRTFEDWRHTHVDASDHDPELWLLARASGAIAGVCLCLPHDAARPEVGWVAIVAVLRPWRRRGLATALLTESFRRFWARGTRSVGLGVDAESPTGAVGLYERVGMYVEHRLAAWDRPFD